MYVTGAAQPQVTIKNIERHKLLIPSECITNQFNIIIKNITSALEKYKEQNQNLIKQRDLLLPRLMNGTIEVK